jgi:hypothetical protein
MERSRKVEKELLRMGKVVPRGSLRGVQTRGDDVPRSWKVRECLADAENPEVVPVQVADGHSEIGASDPTLVVRRP